MLAIKANVDRDQRPGRFLLTGSAYVLTIPRLADSLAGRMQIIRLYPFTQGELLGKEEHFVDTLLAGNNDMLTTGELDKEAYVELSTRGGYPEAVARTSDRRRGRWFDSYIETYVAKDIADLAAIERLDVLPRLLQLVAARTASVLNVEDLARDIRMSPKSVASYLALLETTFFIHRLSAWSPNRTTRITHKPKVFVSDPGLAAHLRSESIRSLLRPGGDPGPLLETFVVMELVRQLSWSNERATIHHFRTRDGVEVDAVLEAADGRVAGVEVKASSSVKPHDLRGLRYLAEQAGDRFVGGVLLYSGRETLSFGNRIWATPMSSLWQSL